MQIINFFYELARQHVAVKGFIYGRAGGKGAGNEFYPLVWVDDPIYGVAVNNTIRYTLNVDILGIPKIDAEIGAVQSAAFLVGLSFVEKIKSIQGTGVEGFSFVSLSDYYDNKAAGHRFTYTVVQANPANLCIDYYDPDKVFPKLDGLPDFSVAAPDGCAVFTDKKGLPNFEV